MKIKPVLSQIAARLINVRYIGRLVRIAEEVWYIAETKAVLTQQIPALLETVSKLNHQRQGPEVENLVKSVPVALRTLRRELAESKQEMHAMRKELDQLKEAFDTKAATQRKML